MKVGDMTIEELDRHIQRKVKETLIGHDSDEGLDLRDEIRDYLTSHIGDSDVVSHDEVMRILEKDNPALHDVLKAP
jgi:hypothetical protein